MADHPRYDIFISYAGGDEPWASKFVDALTKEGVSVWYDRAQLKGGERWQETIERALRESRIVIALLSPDYLSNPTTFFELGAAVGDKKKIIPILTQDVEQTRVPSLLRERYWVREPSPQLAGKRVAEVLEQDRIAEAK